MDPDITRWEVEGQEQGTRATGLAPPAAWGETWWYGGEDGPLRCAVRVVRAAIRFRRPGRQADYTEAPLPLVELRPLAGTRDPLVLATTLPVQHLADARGSAWVYGQRWTIEETFKDFHSGFGLDATRVSNARRLGRLVAALTVAMTWLHLLALSEVGRVPRAWSASVVTYGRASSVALALAWLRSTMAYPQPSVTCLPPRSRTG